MYRYPVTPPSGWRGVDEALLMIPEDRPKVSAFPSMVWFLRITPADVLQLLKIDHPSSTWTICDVSNVLEFRKEAPIEWFETIRLFHRERYGHIYDMYDPKLCARLREYTITVTEEHLEFLEDLVLFSFFQLPLDSKVYFKIDHS